MSTSIIIIIIIIIVLGREPASSFVRVWVFRVSGWVWLEVV